ncbi:hypothetical protein L3X38_038768 [Prunus dulcis]|uniref:Uncharacterized protein n=1 Tax=Prunus dulcis TaxID=3755 RepID=A0AAD4YRU2_PRUDU|nr:hypothetical protein L3X38_038768 [Prunus dulcis]
MRHLHGERSNITVQSNSVPRTKLGHGLYTTVRGFMNYQTAPQQWETLGIPRHSGPEDSTHEEKPYRLSPINIPSGTTQSSRSVGRCRQLIRTGRPKQVPDEKTETWGTPVDTRSSDQ